jgi:hypothetical protein
MPIMRNYPIKIKIRQRIAQNCELESPLQGSVEVDESYFGAQRVRGKRGRVLMAKQLSLVFVTPFLRKSKIHRSEQCYLSA